MEARYGFRRGQLNLTDKKLELDQLFDSIINRLPDLCMPPSYRLAGENDFFNTTKDIKLRPFKKQRVFETCISPELAIKSSLKSYGSDSELNRIISPTTPQSKRNQTPEPRINQIATKHYPSLSKTEQASTSGNELSYKKRGKLSLEQIELEKKRKMRETLKKRYSNIQAKKRMTEEKIVNRIGYDRLFTRPPSANYPYLNPIPDCMMTDDNIDNLREIIVSAVDIEWRMLTPVRPQSDYEEKYFDRLIELHRNRYKSRLETGYFNTHQLVPFKHIRHTFLVHYDRYRKPSQTLALQDDAKLRRKSSYWLKKPSKSETTRQPNIPMLTLTSDETQSERIFHSKEEASEDDEFNYEHYSRFSKQNSQRSANHDQMRSNEEGAPENLNILENHRDLNSNNGLFEDRVEEILSQLVNINMTDS